MVEEKTKLANVDFSIFKDRHEINLSDNYPDPQYILKINEIPCFPKGDIQAIKGKAKQGKSHAIICIIAALLNGKFLCLESNIIFPKVCFFSTEEHPRSLAKLIRKVHRICEWPEDMSNEQFKVYTLRDSTDKERKEYISQKIESEKPDIVFIDNLRGLIDDFNDLKKSATLITELKKISTRNDCAICCVLHTNKAANDTNMRGHLGTDLLNECSDGLEVMKKESIEGCIFHVEETDGRNALTGKWSFQLDDNAIPIAAEPQPSKSEIKADKQANEIRENFQHILVLSTCMTYAELKNAYMELTGASKPTFDRHKRKAELDSIIRKTNDEKYTLW